MSDLNETIGLAEAAAKLIEENTVGQHMPKVTAIRALCAKASKTCEWRENESDECWDTACGEKYILTTGDGPLKHGFNFCHHCGKRLVEKKHETTKEG